MRLYKKELNRIINAALKEDVGSGDITTNLIIPRKTILKTFLLVKEDGVIAGLPVAKAVFAKLDKKITWKSLVKEGDKVSAGTKIAQIRGSCRVLLTGERTALNFLQRMSGIATAVSKYIDQLSGLKTKILDTRKTVPGLRVLDKYAVKIGGGTNHRMGLYDMVMIKDNHIKAAGSITEAVRQIRKNLKRKIKIEIETTTINEIKEALNAHVDIIMLDNMSLPEMKEAIALINNRVKVEASGGIDLNSIRDVAETGVDFISVGALTHSVKALDISMYFE